MPALNSAPAALDDVENAAQRAWQNGQQSYTHAMLRMNAGDQALAEMQRNDFNLSNQSAMAVIVQALMGSDPTLAATILAQRSAGAQPQSGGGPGQPVIYPVQQALPSQGGGVYIVNPTTGAVTKA